MQQGAKDKTCEHEPNWKEMFAVLGDWDKQETIRQANPAVDHCTKLKISADACDGCEFNPHRKSKEVKELPVSVKEYYPMIENSLLLYDYIEMGLISNLSQLTPLEAILVRIVHNYFRTMKIASSMSRL